ncbi:MAG: response regulator transcription factor [Lachnospiraceae bacterium]|nr:response regulator transcription factor [Lachnospiraceae bacterium]
MKILYAEDERQLSMAVNEILKFEGYSVDPVYDGEEALEHLKKEKYDLVILDIMMPRLDGMKVLSIMRANDIFTPVILLTAKSEVEDRIEGFDEGADDYLSKPFAMKELIAHINAIVRRNKDYKLKNLEIGNLYLDCSSNEIKTEHGSLRISPKESLLLSELIKNNGSYLIKRDLAELLRSEDDDKEDETMVDLYSAYLKNKLRQIHANVKIVNDNKGAYKILIE